MAEEKTETKKEYREYGNHRRQKFDLLSLSLHPKDLAETTSKGLFWCWVLIPLIIAFVWGIYDRSSIAGVLGMSGRRATGQVLNETRDFAKGVHSLQQGRGFQPGQLRGSEFDEAAAKEDEPKLIRR